MRASAILSVVIVVACAPTAHSQSLPQQGQCAVQAKTAYQEFEAEWKQGGEIELVTSNYESHYNAKLQKCLMLLSMTNFSKRTQKLSETVILVDAYERRGYASYMWIDRNNLPDTIPFLCTLTPTHDETKTCTTRAEFDAYVAGYMEQ